MAAHLISNTDKDYKCVQCGDGNISVIRADKENPRLKCNGCSFLFDANDALAAEKAGAIPSSSPETLAGAEDPTTIEAHVNHVMDKVRETKAVRVPRYPKYVLVTKDRSDYAFTTQKDFKKVALTWESFGYKYDIFELTSKKLDVKVDIT